MDVKNIWMTPIARWLFYKDDHTIKFDCIPHSVTAVPWTWPMARLWRVLPSSTSPACTGGPTCGATTPVRRSARRQPSQRRRTRTASSPAAVCPPWTSPSPSKVGRQCGDWLVWLCGWVAGVVVWLVWLSGWCGWVAGVIVWLVSLSGWCGLCGCVVEWLVWSNSWCGWVAGVVEWLVWIVWLCSWVAGVVK